MRDSFLKVKDASRRSVRGLYKRGSTFYALCTYESHPSETEKKWCRANFGEDFWKDIAAAKKKLEFVYDSMGRRIQKKVYVWNAGTSAYDLSTTHNFLYDTAGALPSRSLGEGWNCLAELNGSGTVLRSYAWGLDLSGSMQGAGGVGGLLVMNNTSDSSNHFYAYDGNGNVVALVNAATGEVSAEYEYGPFGETIRQTGTMASANTHRFSTKAQDESGLYYYGYRYLDASTGRWVSKDLIEEEGGLNLYGFVGNNSINFHDPFGLACTGDAILDDPVVRAQIQTAWTVSQYKPGTKIPYIPAGLFRKGEQTEREHGFFVMKTDTPNEHQVSGLIVGEKTSNKAYDAAAVPSGACCGMHTHPYSGRSDPSSGDAATATGRGIPEYMIGKTHIGKIYPSGRQESFNRKDLETPCEKRDAQCDSCGKKE